MAKVEIKLLRIKWFRPPFYPRHQKAPVWKKAKVQLGKLFILQCKDQYNIRNPSAHGGKMGRDGLFVLRTTSQHCRANTTSYGLARHAIHDVVVALEPEANLAMYH